MPKEKTGLCDVSTPHEPHDEWVPNPLWPVDPKAEASLLHCPGIPFLDVETEDVPA